MRQVFGDFTAYPAQSMLRGKSGLTILLAAAIVLTFFFYSSSSSGPSQIPPPKPPSTLTSTQSTHWPGWQGIKHLVVFGDSYTSTGFNIAKAQPDEVNPLGNPPYPGHTSANGPTWIGFLTTTHNATFIKTLNFAMGGATVDGDLIRQYMSTIHSFKVQVKDLYLPSYSRPTEKFNWKADDTLFAVFFGINDINNSHKDRMTEVLDKDIAEYADLLDTIYHTGARNFLLMNVPAFDRSPVVMGKDTTSQREESDLITAFNVNITRVATNLTTTYPDARTFVFDTNALYHQVLDNPCSHLETCALKDLTGNCNEYQRGMGDWYASDPKCPYAVDEYFWLNSLHPGFRIHNATAKAIAAQLSARV